MNYFGQSYPSVGEAKQFMSTNNEANMARINGKFTSDGVEAADQDSEFDGMDLQKAKYFIGLGGTMTPLPGMSPGMF